MLAFFKSKTSEDSYQFLEVGFVTVFLDAKKVVFISSFLSLFLAVIAEELTPG